MSASGPHDEESFGESLDAMGGPVYVVGSDERTLRRVVAGARERASVASVRVIGEAGELRSFRSRFRAAARAADLVDRGDLSFHAVEETDGTPVFVGPDAVVAPVIVGTVTTTLCGTDESVAAPAYTECERQWAATEEFPLHTPPLSAVRETLAAEFGDTARGGFDEALATVERSGDPEAFDEVLAVLLVAGREGVMHYDLSKWGEDIGLASKATFSRKKNRLEELGVLRTEKVSVDLGRPRQRLLLTDEYRERVESDGIADIVANVAY